MITNSFHTTPNLSMKNMHSCTNKLQRSLINQDGTSNINICSGAQPGSCHAEILQVKRGQMVVFRMDLPHSGSGYVNSNMRWFTYLDMAGLPRGDDKTNILENQWPSTLNNFAKIYTPY